MNEHDTIEGHAHVGDDELDRDECLTLLASQEIGRLGVVDGDQPLIFPVNFYLEGDTVVFRTDPGTKLSTAPLKRVAFEVDHVDPATRKGWSVLVQGVAQEITEAIDPRSERERELPVEPWAAGPRSHWVRILSRSVSGRRVRAKPGDRLGR